MRAIVIMETTDRRKSPVSKTRVTTALALKMKSLTEGLIVDLVVLALIYNRIAIQINQG